MTVAQIMNSWLQNSDFIYLFIYFFNSDFKLKKVGKTTRSFRYDLNQIPYDSTVEVTNRFKGLDMIECLKNYGQGFMTWYRRLLSRPPSPRRKKCKRQNGWGCLTNSWEEKRSKKQMRKGKIYPSQCRVPKNRKERLKKPKWSMQRNRGKQQNGKDEISSRKLEVPREHFMQRWAQ